MKLIFLDIDGVLNGHDWCEGAKSNLIRRGCVQLLNEILRETGAYLAISSAWRYMVHGGGMTVDGFEYLLRTHGVECDGKIIGITETDAVISERANQVRHFLASYGGVFESFVILDDLPLFDGDLADRFVQTDGTIGLTSSTTERAIQILNTPLLQPTADSEPSSNP